MLPNPFSSRDPQRYICPKHGDDVTQAIRLKGIGKKDGLYCAKCQAEFWAKTLKRVTPK